MATPDPTPVEPAPTPRRAIPPERLAMAERLYLEGLPVDRLRQRLREEYGVSLKTARRYLKRVLARFAARPQPSPEAVRARAEAMLLETYELAKVATKYVVLQNGTTPVVRKKTKCVPDPQLAVMATVATRLVELAGAEPVKRIDVTSQGEPLRVFLPVESEP